MKRQDFGRVEEKYPIVETTHGKIVGENRDRVAVFRGIPYGSGTSRERRFQRPLPAKDWTGVRDCTRNGPISIQPGESITASKNFGFYFSGGIPEKFGGHFEYQSEDCLNLCVLTPGLDDGKRPVLVYFHGGGFATNSGSIIAGSDRLVREQDIVTVGINHRLHAWGYLYLGDFDARFKDSGTAGLLDLILALEWVRDNIAAFGGDPGNVAIMGESGGAMKVNNVLHMPEAKGLVHKAIAVSGSLPVGKVSRAEGAATAEKILYTLGVRTNDLDKLLWLPAEEIWHAVFSTPGVDLMAVQPVADGIHLPEANGTGFEPGPFAEQIPMLIGSSEDEMAAFNAPLSFDVTPENLRAKLIERGPQIGIPFTEENVDDVLHIFAVKNRKYDTADQTFLKIASQAGYLCKGAFFQAMKKAQAGHAPAYAFLNTYDAPHNYILNRRYAWHTFDLPLGLRIVPFPELEPLSRHIADAWGAFLRTGDPSTPDLQWLPFTEERRLTMIFDDNCRLEEDPLREEREAVLALLPGERG